MKKWILLFLLTLTACSTHQPVNGTAIDDMNVDLHQGVNDNFHIPSNSAHASVKEVSQALMPDLRFRSPKRVDYFQRRFDVSVKDTPARDFYMGLVADTPISIIISPQISNKKLINLSLK